MNHRSATPTEINPLRLCELDGFLNERLHVTSNVSWGRCCKNRIQIDKLPRDPFVMGGTPRTTTIKSEGFRLGSPRMA
jgi:hypothetical protein